MASACDLRVTEAWIRTPPPGVQTLAGYARLVNSSDHPLVITGVSSALFAHVQMHESAQRDGVMQMRPLATLTIQPNAAVRFEPDGKHFMLIDPNKSLKSGDQVSVQLRDSSGCAVNAQFTVGTPATAVSMPGMNMGSMK